MTRNNSEFVNNQDLETSEQPYQLSFARLVLEKLLAEDEPETAEKKASVADLLAEDDEEEIEWTEVMHEVNKDAKHWERVWEHKKRREALLKKRYEAAKEETETARNEMDAAYGYLNEQMYGPSEWGETQPHGYLDEDNHYDPYSGTYIGSLIKDVYFLSLERGEVITAKHNGRNIVMDASKYADEAEALEAAYNQWNGDRKSDR